MNPRRLLRLYPRAWRERYGEEVAALIDETRPGGFAAFDLLAGAGREWIRLAATKFTGRNIDRSNGWNMECPHCKTTIGFDNWLQMKMRSGPVAGRLVRECGSCGSLIRLTQSWSVARSLWCAFLLILILTEIPGTQLSRPFIWGKEATLIIVYGSWFFASRSVRLEVVPIDHGTASSS